MTATLTTLPTIRRRMMEAHGSFQYRFEDMGVEIEGGFSAGQFCGVAEVTYYADDGDLHWFVNDITLDCQKYNGKGWDVRQITLDRGMTLHGPLYLSLWTELVDGSRKEHIAAKVMDDFEGGL